MLGEASRAIVVLSRVRQSRLLKDRIEIWRQCVRELLQASKPERLYELMDNGTIRPVVAQTFPFERAPEAHRFITERRNIGKVVLTP